MTTSNDLFTLYPELILTVTVLVVLTADLFLSRRSKWLLTPLTIFGLLLTGIGCFFVWGVNDTVFNGFYVRRRPVGLLQGRHGGDRRLRGAVRALVPVGSGTCRSASTT